MKNFFYEINNMEIKTKKKDGRWTVLFKHGVQSFTLDYKADTKEEAEQMKKMLNKCFVNAFGVKE